MSDSTTVARPTPSFKNEAHVTGTLVKDATTRYTSSGKAVLNLALVTKYEQYSEFHNVVAWEKLAEKAAELKKGDWVRVVGRLQSRSWADKQTGEKKYRTEIVAFQLSIPAEEPPPITPDAIKRGTNAARAILQPAAQSENIHGLEVSDADIPF